MIQIPDIPALRVHAVNMPTANLGAATAPDEAMGRVAQSIASLGEHFTKVAQDAQRLRNAELESAARNKLAMNYATFQQDLETENDPAARIEKAKNFFTESKGLGDDPELPEAVRSRLRMYHDDFATRGMIEVASGAARLQEQRTRQQIDNELSAARAARDRGGVGDVVTRAVDAGLMIPEKGEEIIKSHDELFELESLEAGVEIDPKSILSDLEHPDFAKTYPNVSSDKLPKIKRAAEAAIKRKRGEELDLIEDGIASGVFNEADLAESEYLRPSDIEKIKSTLAAQKPVAVSAVADAWDVYFKLAEDFKNPAVTDEDYAEKHTNARLEIMNLLPAKAQGDLKAAISSRNPAYRREEKPTPPPKRTELFETSQGIIQRSLKANAFGDITTPGTPVAEKAYRKAEDLRFEVQKYLDGNPEVTVPELREHVDELISGGRAPTAAKKITIPGLGGTMRPLLGISSGANDASDALLPPRDELNEFIK